MMKLYSYYKDGFYSGIDSEDGKLKPTSVTIHQKILEIPTITFTCFDFDKEFEVIKGELFYKGEYLDGVTKFAVSLASVDDPQKVVATLEFPVDVPKDFGEGVVGSGCCYESEEV